MVCKEDVLSWFKDLESYKRIDVMYELLNMCLPFELRFLGSCVEEIGKHTYQELRGPTINANEMEKLLKDLSLNQGLLDDCVRHRVLIYLSLLSSRNYSVANWLYKNLLRTEWLEDYICKGNNVKDDENLQSEFLLLFVMALHHPAFTFEQKLYFGKILTHLLDIRENRNRISPKPSLYGYPPGFGYPTIKAMTIPEVPPISTKPSIPIAPHLEDAAIHQQLPGLPHLPPPPPQQQQPSSQDFIPWNRPGFTCGAPDVPPFPPPQVSTIVSQSTSSPIHSRSGSPHRNIMTQSSIRPPPPPPPQQPPLLETIPLAAPLPVDPTAITNAASFSFIFPPENLKLDDELNSMVDERIIMENPWSTTLSCIPPPPPPLTPTTTTKDTTKQMNGIRFGLASSGPTTKGPPPTRPFLLEQQLQSLNINDNCSTTIDNCCNSLQRSNSSSSSSLNRSPPDTPVPTTTICCGGGGGGSLSTISRGTTTITTTDKVRVNGLAPLPPPPPPPPLSSSSSATTTTTPQLSSNSVGGPLGIQMGSNGGSGGDTSSPPLPPQPTFNNVPYTTYPTQFTAIPPSRTMFQYTNPPQSYRPPFTTHFPTYQTNDNSFPTYTIQPYMSIIYSSPQFQATRNPNCYNCGAMGHFGQDCTGQNIEEITQKKTYMLDYQTSHLPDTEK